MGKLLKISTCKINNISNTIDWFPWRITITIYNNRQLLSNCRFPSFLLLSTACTALSDAPILWFFLKASIIPHEDLQTFYWIMLVVLHLGCLDFLIRYWDGRDLRHVAIVEISQACLKAGKKRCNSTCNPHIMLKGLIAATNDSVGYSIMSP